MTTEATAANPHEGGFFKKAWDWIKKEFGFVEDEAGKLSKDIALLGNEIANELKNGNLVKVIEGALPAIAGAINPALVPLVSGLELQLPKLIDKITGVAQAVGTEITRTPAQQADDLAKYLEGLKGVSNTGFANAVGGINAIVQEYATENTGTIVAEPAHLIASAQVIHSLA